MITKKIAGVLCTAALLAGCAAPKTLYNWDGYQTSIYQYYQQDGLSPEQQIMTLKEIVENHGPGIKPCRQGYMHNSGCCTARPAITGKHWLNSIPKKRCSRNQHRL